MEHRLSALLQLHLHSLLNTGFNKLHEDNCKARRQTFKLWDLVRIILEIWRYLLSMGHVSHRWGDYTLAPYHVVKSLQLHHNDVMMSAMASQITGVTIVYSTVYSGQICWIVFRKHENNTFSFPISFGQWDSAGCWSQTWSKTLTTRCITMTS